MKKVYIDKSSVPGPTDIWIKEAKAIWAGAVISSMSVKQKNEDYWDLNNPIVKWLLMGMFIVIVIGVIYYVISWFTIMN